MSVHIGLTEVCETEERSPSERARVSLSPCCVGSLRQWRCSPHRGNSRDLYCITRIREDTKIIESCYVECRRPAFQLKTKHQLHQPASFSAVQSLILHPATQEISRCPRALSIWLSNPVPPVLDTYVVFVHIEKYFFNTSTVNLNACPSPPPFLTTCHSNSVNKPLP